MVIFDCNGVLVDGELLATAIVSQEFMRAGFPLTPDIVARYFTGRRAADMFAEVEIAAGRKLPANLRQYRRPHDPAALPRRIARHQAHDLCAVLAARAEMRGILIRPRPHPRQPGEHRPDPLLRAQLFSASDVLNGKPAPDLFLHVSAKMRVRAAECVVVEDSSVGVAAGVAAGMTVIGFAGGSHAGNKLARHCKGRRAAVISDMRALKSTIIDLRGW